MGWKKAASGTHCIFTTQGWAVQRLKWKEEYHQTQYPPALSDCWVFPFCFPLDKNNT